MYYIIILLQSMSEASAEILIRLMSLTIKHHAFASSLRYSDLPLIDPPYHALSN